VAAYRFGEQAGSRGFSSAAWPREQVCVGDAISLDCVAKGLYNVILSDDIFPALWSPPAVESLCHFRSSLIKEILPNKS
jgi:hypothetical protein